MLIEARMTEDLMAFLHELGLAEAIPITESTLSRIMARLKSSPSKVITDPTTSSQSDIVPIMKLTAYL